MQRGIVNSEEPLNISLGEHLTSEMLKKRVLKITGGISHLPLVQILNSPPPQLLDRPHLVVFKCHEDVIRFVEDLRFFNHHIPSVYILPHFDVTPCSSLYPKKNLTAERIGWLHAALTAKPGELFLTSIRALQQKTLPKQVLLDHKMRLSVEDELPPSFQKVWESMGYLSTPMVEDVGQFSHRGSILDLFSPTYCLPIRLELFGDFIESIRFFDPETQRSKESLKEILILPVKETLYPEDPSSIIAQFQKDLTSRKISQKESLTLIRFLSRREFFSEIDFFLPYFYQETESPANYFNTPLYCWFVDFHSIETVSENFISELNNEYESSLHQLVAPPVNNFFQSQEKLAFPPDSTEIHLTNLSYDEEKEISKISYPTYFVDEIKKARPIYPETTKKIFFWINQNYHVFISCSSMVQAQRLKTQLERADLKIVICKESEFLWNSWIETPHTIHIIPRPLSSSVRLEMDHLLFLRDLDFFERKFRSRTFQKTPDKTIQSLVFGDLKPSDFVVHIDHGVGIFEGLKRLSVNGGELEFVHLKYLENASLYVPVYRIHQIQKFSGPSSTHLLDKLGGGQWEKTKIKVKNQLRDLASELLTLYAKRVQIKRPPFSAINNEYLTFENSFPFEETQDQLSSIECILKDLTQEEKPMDRLICGDVGFGKTEIAMRSAFKIVQDGFQVALLAPTTVLTFQHLQTFQKRFTGWPFTICALNRLVSTKKTKEILSDLKDGKVDIIIGTHRLLSKDVVFKKIGLLIIDEEHKFGVTHKEKIKKLKIGIDTLTLSATPIPRTLNLSLLGIRDLSLINTPPVDRIPTRTFVCKFDHELFKKAILSEMGRGGQVFFLHNRVQNIESVANELKVLLPNLRIKTAHGQMSEDLLEKTLVEFYNREIDVLVCTTIIESGMDVPNANTMLINDAHTFGLSQLYQLRGRVGRSKERAYCYLVVPNNKELEPIAQERLKVIQENVALGSGIKIAHYDLELRGTGNILGDDQSGHIQAVGYDLYLELLENEIRTLKGLPIDQDIEPDINLKLPALIPDSYISDIRIRLTYYRLLSQISSHDEVTQIENDLRDQFGTPPDPVLNLIGIMLIRHQCKLLSVRDISSGVKTVTLAFTEKTRFSAETAIRLVGQDNKKYSITPDSRFVIRMNEITWPAIYDELLYLNSLIDSSQEIVSKILSSTRRSEKSSSEVTVRKSNKTKLYNS